MTNNNVTDLRKHFALDKRAHGFLNAIRACAAVSDAFGTALSFAGEADQRLLCQIAAWRIEGGSLLPATEGLVHMPLLVGMGFESIAAAADRLVEAGVIVNHVIRQDKAGNIVEMGFSWPAFDRLLLEGETVAKGPQLTDIEGRPLRG